MTKTFTAILVLQLVEQGKLDLDEPVSRYSDDFEDDSVKIKHLLSHTSEGTPGEKLNYNPDRFEYLKAILEKKTGKPLRQLFVETFLDPLAMRDSVPGPDVADDDKTWAVLGKDNLARYRRNLTKFARPYTYWGGGETVYSGYPLRDFWASAGLLSTVRDLAKYDVAVDRHELLKAETLARAWTPFLSNAGQPLAHGLGWFVTDYRGARLVWHFGHWGTGFSAIYVKVPARRLTLIALANSEALADHHYQVGRAPPMTSSPVPSSTCSCPCSEPHRRTGATGRHPVDGPGQGLRAQLPCRIGKMDRRPPCQGAQGHTAGLEAGRSVRGPLPAAPPRGHRHRGKRPPVHRRTPGRPERALRQGALASTS